MALLTEEQLKDYLDQIKPTIKSEHCESGECGECKKCVKIQKRKAYYEANRERRIAYTKAYNMAKRVRAGKDPVGKRGRPRLPPELKKKPKYNYVKKPKKVKNETLAIRLPTGLKSELREVTSKEDRLKLFQTFVNLLVEYRKEVTDKE